MGAIALQMPDGKQRSYPEGVTGADVAASIGQRLAKDAVAVRLGERVLDLRRPLPSGGALRILTLADPEGLEVYRHTATHIMAQAVRRIWPETRLAIGPVIDDGFYYDMEPPVALSEEDLPRIEAEMAKIVAEDLPIAREVWSREQARQYFVDRGDPYKVEIIDDLPPDAEVTVYRQGEFLDLCRGPHLPSTGRLRAYKLLSVAGAYWRGDERRPMLQRLYGTAFAEQKELEHFLWVREEARRRDHRKLGPELDLFTLHEEAPGFPFWHDKGYRLYRALENFSRDLQRQRGYQEVRTPVLFRSDLYEQSGHWGFFRPNMFTFQQDGEWYGMKPMNCPAHCLMFKEQMRSYRDLPLRLAEYGQLTRYERSGTLHGLLRVRSLHQDDAHLFVREDQIEDEIRETIGLLDELYGTFGLTYSINLATRPAEYMGSLETWDRAEAALADALRAMGKDFVLAPGDGAFYGPKLEFDITDALGRKWQCGTVQVDWNLPERFDLKYIGADGQEHRPVMIHRAIMGTLERFIGILVEHFAGAFPSWLAPEQARVLPVSEKSLAYGRRVATELSARGISVTVDESAEKIGRKIRDAQLAKVPYMLVVGEREEQAGTVAVRSRGSGDLGAEPLPAFAVALQAEIRERRLQTR
jgi:threonyl-tRNA synthetase